MIVYYTIALKMPPRRCNLSFPHNEAIDTEISILIRDWYNFDWNKIFVENIRNRMIAIQFEYNVEVTAQYTNGKFGYIDVNKYIGDTHYMERFTNVNNVYKCSHGVLLSNDFVELIRGKILSY